jgi:predicted SAM-dependent methyltransferase
VAVRDEQMTQTIKLNLGCGVDATPGYHNLDNSYSLLIQRNAISRIFFGLVERLVGKELYRRFPTGVRRCSITKPLPYAAGSVQVIYSSHTLEHLARDKAETLLRDAYDLLAPQGILRLALPNLESKARDYLASLEKFRASETLQLPCDQFMGSTLLGLDVHFTVRRPLRLYRGLLSRDRHMWMWDAPSLMGLLRTLGFRAVEERRYRDSRLAEVAQLDLEAHQHESFYVEAVK